MAPDPDILELEERYALAVRAADDGLWDWDLEKNQIYFCPRWKSMLGFAEDEIGNSPNEWLERIYQKDLGRLLGKLSDHLYRGASRFASEHRILHRDGRYRWVLSRGIALRADSGKVTRIVGSQTDITERKQAEQRLRYDASHDPLTGLPNRTQFGLQLQRASTRMSYHAGPSFALLLLDLDGFKAVNDTWGHQTGDLLLKAVSDRLRNCVRPGDTVARLGGDEFGILLRTLGGQQEEVVQIAKRIQAKLAAPFQFGNQEVTVAASIGIAFANPAYDSASDLLRDADSAMYRAKTRGQLQYEVFDPACDTDGLVLLQSEANLRQALQEGQFQLLYQPFFSVVARKICGLEALLRWRDRERGSIPPQHFIQAACERGIVIPLTEWMLRTACAQIKSWESAGLPLIRLSLNVSPGEVNNPEFVDVVSRTLRENALDPARLQLEMKESTFIDSGQAAAGHLDKLCSQGVRVYLDHFGARYSSLIVLRKFPIHGLKVHESLVQTQSDAADTTGAAGLIELAHDMDLEVMLTEVENPDSAFLSAYLNCDYVQGNAISEPLDAASCEEFLRKNRHVPGPSGDSRLFNTAASR